MRYDVEFFQSITSDPSSERALSLYGGEEKLGDREEIGLDGAREQYPVVY